MKKTTGRQAVVALLWLAPALVVLSALLELVSVARLATERAATECDLIAHSVRRQLDFLARERRGEPLADVASDPRLQLVLSDAIGQAPSVLHVAVCDTAGVAVAHSMPSQAGALVERYRPLPRAAGLAESLGVLGELAGAKAPFESYTPLSVDGRPWASIRVIVSPAFLWDGVRHAFLRGLVVSLAVLTIAIGVGVAVSRWVFSRFRVLEAGVEAIREGRFAGGLADSGADEFGRLARQLDLLGRQFQREREEGDAGRALHRAADLLGDGILVLDATGRIVLANARACRVIGIDAVAAPGHLLADLLPPSHAVLRLVEQLQAAPERSLSVRLTDGVTAGNGAARTDPVAVGHRIENPGPEASDPGVLVEIKQAHEQTALHNLVDQSRVLSRLGEMASGVAHELRDPLQTLTLELDSIAAAAREGEAVEPSVRQAREKIARLDRAIRGFLKIARLRPPSVGPVDANALLREVGEASRTNADLAGLEISLDLEDGLPRVAGDDEVLRQAVGNLLGNALQAYPSRDGGIVLRSRRTGETIRLTVADSGPGIPPEELDHVFELFYSTRDGGTGVGLALVQQSVEMLGGRVTIASSPGKGTEVTLELPMAVSA